MLANHLVHCPFDKVRTKFAEILETVINVSLPFEAAEIEEHVLLLEERNKHEPPSPAKHNPFPHSIGVLGLIDSLIEQVDPLPFSRLLPHLIC
jgi:hypothetical protein